MTHVRSSIALILVAVAATMVIAAVAMARSDVPPPYAGLKNPFDWNDATVQAQGKQVYQKSCAPCHGLGGSNLAAANFVAAGYSDQVQTEPDYYFWAVSEGKPKDGMPGFKSTLTDNERWQVLTYIWSMRQSAPATGASGTKVPILSGGPMFPSPTISLAVDESKSAQSGLTLTTSLVDANGKPVTGQPVTFLLKKDFFVADWMQIGEVVSNKDGKAIFEYLPSEDGNIRMAARWGNLEATSGFGVSYRVRSYQTEAGIRLPTIGPEVAVGLDVASAEMGEGAPTGGIRLPGGTLSWLLLFVAVIITIWTTYFRVFRQVVLIPEPQAREGLTVKLVPYAAMVFVLVVGVVLAFVILHGPYTHLELGR